MTNFEFSRPDTLAQPDQLAGLSDAARKSLTNLPIGTTAVNELLRPELYELAPDVYSWAKNELDGEKGALASWKRYESELGVTVPANLFELIQAKPNIIPVLNRLADAKKDLINSKEQNPDNIPIAETMHLLIMPWEAILNNLDDIPKWAIKMRQTQGCSLNDSFNDEILENISRNSPLYRYQANVNQAYSAKVYLNIKMAADGAWGLMLAQNSGSPGLSRLLNLPAKDINPDALTKNGTARLQVNGQVVDRMGIFEWLCLTFQENPAKYMGGDISLLLANHITSRDRKSNSLIGFCRLETVVTNLIASDNTRIDNMPRLAIS